jgi:hypothetical protein
MLGIKEMDKRKIIILYCILSITLLPNCAHHQKILTIDKKYQGLRSAEIADSVFVNSLFAYITYKVHGFFPTTCSKLKESLPDDVLQRYEGKNVCTDMFTFEVKGNPMGVNWDIMANTSYKLKGDSSIIATVNEGEKQMTYTVPLKPLKINLP